VLPTEALLPTLLLLLRQRTGSPAGFVLLVSLVFSWLTKKRVQAEKTEQQRK